jgi:hypothetical protein
MNALELLAAPASLRPVLLAAPASLRLLAATTHAPSLSAAMAANYTQTLSFALSLFTMTLLVFYRIFKKFTREETLTRLEFLERNLVELALVAMGGGSGVNALLNLIGVG